MPGLVVTLHSSEYWSQFLFIDTNFEVLTIGTHTFERLYWYWRHSSHLTPYPGACCHIYVVSYHSAIFNLNKMLNKIQSIVKKTKSEIYCRLWQLAPVSMYIYTNVILHIHTHIQSKIYEWYFSFLSVCLWIELMCVQFWASLEVVSDSSGLSGRVCVWIQIRQRLQAY